LKRVFLLRAYGDFIVAIQSLIHSNALSKFQIIASSHLLPLFEALPASIIPANLSIQFVDFGIKKSMLNVFTNRYLFQLDTFKQLNHLSAFLNQYPSEKNYDFIDNNYHKWLLELGTAHQFGAIGSSENIYLSFHAFFESQVPMIQLPQKQNYNILILPSARIAKRNLPDQLVKKIKQKHASLNDKVIIANYRSTTSDSKMYSNFIELVQLIEEADFVYGADSLPIHLSNILQKPHFILYPKSVTSQFFTPYALANNSHANFKSFT